MISLHSRTVAPYNLLSFFHHTCSSLSIIMIFICTWRWNFSNWHKPYYKEIQRTTSQTQWKTSAEPVDLMSFRAKVVLIWTKVNFSGQTTLVRELVRTIGYEWTWFILYSAKFEAKIFIEIIFWDKSILLTKYSIKYLQN